MGPRLAFAALLALSTLFGVDARAEKVALVVGIQKYRHAGSLRQAARDAEVVAEALTSIGFRVRLAKNLSFAEFHKELLAFEAALDEAEVGLFYFAGHGLQVDGENFLVPTDATLDDPDQVVFQTIHARMVLETMADASDALNIVVLDACRTNPFPKRWTSESRAGAKRGLDSIPADRVPPGLVLAYATNPNDVAEDNGMYARALVQQLTTPCQDLDSALRRVQVDIVQRSAGRQRPWVEDSAGMGPRRFVPAGCKKPEEHEDVPAVSETPPPLPTDRPDLQIGGGQTLVWVPGGTFRMGSPNDEGSDDEHPDHEVAVSGLYILESEVTQGLWKRVMGQNPSHFSECGDRCPVENVTWREALQFANRLSGREKRTPVYDLSVDPPAWNPTANGFRLLTEAEWEHAARGGAPHPYAGSARPELVAWYQNNAEGRTHPVCTKARNGFGLCDMSGNVWEWVWDAYGPYRGGFVRNPVGPSDGEMRVSRGGAWFYPAQSARVAARSWWLPTVRNQYRGFRVAAQP